MSSSPDQSRPGQNDLVIGFDRWIKWVDVVGRQDRAVNLDSLIDPLDAFFSALEINCVADCCGIAAYSFMPEDVRRARESMDIDQLRSGLRAVRHFVENSGADIFVCRRLNHYLVRSVAMELFYYFEAEVDKPIRALSWPDLAVDGIPDSDARCWLDFWSDWLPKKEIEGMTPLFLSRLGDWFLRKPDGSAWRLSVTDGAYRAVDTERENFESLTKSPGWQSTYLHSSLVYELHERGIVPSANQCYAFSPHPVVSGRIIPDHVLLMEIGTWQKICSQQFARLPPPDFGDNAPDWLKQWMKGRR